jgi:hypothetical protein
MKRFLFLSALLLSGCATNNINKTEVYLPSPNHWIQQSHEEKLASGIVVAANELNAQCSNPYPVQLINSTDNLSIQLFKFENYTNRMPSQNYYVMIQTVQLSALVDNWNEQIYNEEVDTTTCQIVTKDVRRISYNIKDSID